MTRQAPRRRMRPALTLLAWISSLVAGWPPTASATTLLTSSDVALPLASTRVAQDHDVVVEAAGSDPTLLPDLAPLPEGADLVAYASVDETTHLVAFDTTVALRGGVVARRGDVARRSPDEDSIEIDRDDLGLPLGVAVDAVARVADGYLLSFDTTVAISAGVWADDEDLVFWNGVEASLHLDASTIGIDPALDLDAVDSPAPGVLLVSFDTSGTLGGLFFDDEDVLRFDGASWSLERDGTAIAPASASADLDAIAVPEPTFAVALLATALLLIPLARRRDASGTHSRRFRAGSTAERSPTMTIRSLLRNRLTILLLLVSTPSVAGAVDGVIEINQARALAGGIGLLDAPGFPITLSQRGSYRLTGELNVPAGTTGIEILNDHIEIDLNGFTIFGAGGAQGDGIRAPGTVQGARVANGTVRNMGGDGVVLFAEGSSVERVAAIGNGDNGIQVGRHSSVTRCVARQNAGAGIEAGYSVVEANVISQNDGAGIISDVGVFVKNVIAFNGSTGMFVGVGSVVQGNVIRENDGPGLGGAGGSATEGNALLDNDNGADVFPSSAVQTGASACDFDVC